MLKRLSILILTISPLVGCTSNPVTGRSQLALIPEDQVIQASTQAYAAEMTELQKKGKLETNTATVSRVRSIADRVIRQAVKIRPEAAGWDWQVNVIDDPQVNAFAMAGGKVAVYSGLLEKVKPTDDELAQVLSHEIGHALAGHTREKMSVSAGTELALATVAASRDLSPNTQKALGGAALLAVQLPNSRKMELEADRIGIELAARAGFNPSAAVSLWQKMGAQGGGGGPQFLSTHPSDATRMQALSQLVPQMMPLYNAAKR